MSIHNSISEQELEKLANDIFLSSNNTHPINNQEIITGSPNLKEIHGNEDFVIDDPQASLKDPFISNQQIPKAVAGEGKFFEHDSISFVQDNNVNKQNDLNGIKHSYIPHLHEDLPFSDHKEFREFGDLSKVNPDRFKSQIPNDFSNNPFSYLEDALTNVFINDVKGGWNVGEDLRRNVEQINSFDVYSIRNDFPILGEMVNGRRLVWFDNAATTQKPNAVIDRLSYFYKHENSNIHRAAHELAARATDAYEEARSVVQKFINSSSPNEIVFTRGTTESINLVVCTWGSENLKEGDEIIVSNLEHHANIVPWQLLSKKNGFKIKVIPVNEAGELLIDEYEKLLTPNTKLVSFTHVSNALGTITPAKRIIDLAHQAGAKVLLDGAQSISHIKVDVEQLQPDFFVFSGHKIFGPTGIGVLYGKEELLNSMKPYQGGGNMIQDVTFEKTLFQNSPNRFEAGTGNIADAVGLGEALKYVNKVGIDVIANYEHKLLEYATHLFSQIPRVKLIGTAKEKTSVMSFTVHGYSNDDVGKILNENGIAVRTGHHCAQPILRRLGYETTIRPSFAFYNTFEEIDLFASVISRIV